MPASHELNSLYRQFDRLIDLPLAERQSELQSLRKSGDPLAMQLEGMLIYHQHQSPTESLFSVEELMTAVKEELPWKIASDLRELSRRLRWDPRIGCFQLGHFSLMDCLSVSSIGATYHAHDQSLERDVVLLLLFPRWSENREVRQRSLDASRAVAKIFDTHVATILGSLELEGIFAIVRQWIPGKSLDQWLSNCDSISLEQILCIVRGIASGLQSIHDEKVLHGDLKPANIILRKQTLHPVITDFGTATWISSDESTKWHGGTKGFVAPEILRNEPPSPQSDLYSLGIILQWMTTGVLERESTDKDWQRASQRLSDLRVDHEGLHRLEPVRTLVSSLLHQDPAKRPRDAKTVIDSLSSSSNSEYQNLVLEPSHGGARPLPWDRSPSRRRWIGHAMGLGLTAIASTWGGSIIAKSKPDRGKFFVPGTPSSFEKKLFLAPLDTKANLGFVPRAMYRWLPDYEQGSGLQPLRQGQWEWLHVKSIELPDPPYQIGLLQFTLIFDSDPGQAHYRVEGRLGLPTNPWLVLNKGTNLFGGLYIENVLAHLGPALLQGIVPIHVRLGMMYEQGPRYNTDLPPIALRLKTDTSPYLTGTMDLWSQWGSKPVNIRG
jgi:serine/threonine protein kinase